MVRARATRLAVGISLAAGVVIATACMTPTTILVSLRTNVAYDSTRSIVLSLPVGVNPGPPIAAVTSPWSVPSGDVGTLALVPRDAKDAAVRFMAVMGVTRPAEECTIEAPEGCIFARRALAFLPQAALNVPIGLYAVCAGKPCDADTTCNALGECVSARLDPNACVSEAGCSIEGDPDPSIPLTPGRVSDTDGGDGAATTDGSTGNDGDAGGGKDGAADARDGGTDAAAEAGADAALDGGSDGSALLGEAGVPCQFIGMGPTCPTPTQKCCSSIGGAACRVRSFNCSDDGYTLSRECDDDADCPGGRCCTNAGGTVCTTSCAIKMCSAPMQCPPGMPTCAVGPSSPFSAYCQ